MSNPGIAGEFRASSGSLVMTQALIRLGVRRRRSPSATPGRPASHEALPGQVEMPVIRYHRLSDWFRSTVQRRTSAGRGIREVDGRILARGFPRARPPRTQSRTRACGSCSYGFGPCTWIASGSGPAHFNLDRSAGRNAATAPHIAPWPERRSTRDPAQRRKSDRSAVSSRWARLGWRCRRCFPTARYRRASAAPRRCRGQTGCRIRPCRRDRPVSLPDSYRHLQQLQRRTGRVSTSARPGRPVRL